MPTAISRDASRDSAFLAASTPLFDLLSEAAAIRDSGFGTRVTYSPKVFIPLTELCRDKCGYCTFAKAPARIDAPFLTSQQVLGIARAGAEAGCHEALFTLGERPELRYPLAQEWLRISGYESTVDYLVAMCKLVLDETGLLPHANPGALYPEELARLRAVSASQGMMIESLRDDLDCHRGAPDKTPDRRLATLEAAGALKIPYTTGILVGIGENRQDRIDALQAIAASHRRHGHVQEVIVQNFLPKEGTAMHRVAACPPEEYLWTIAAARLILPPDVHLQAPPNLSDDFGTLLDAGIDDWGGVSPITPDHVNPERPWPAVDRIREVTEAKGFSLAPRLTIYPEFVARPTEWLDAALRFPVMDHCDADLLARDDPGSFWPERATPGVRVELVGKSELSAGEEPPAHLGEWVHPGLRSTQWYSGASVDPVMLVPRQGRAGGAIGEVLAGVLLGQDVGEVEITTLFSARGAEVAKVAEVADHLRRQIVGDAVTFVKNRNINYTNVCTFKCKFCAFSKGPLSLNLRGTPYLLGFDEIQRRIEEAVALGATEVCLQGGIHPDFDGEYYLDVTRAVKAVAPDIHVHGFTALEVTEGARRLGEPLRQYLARLRDVGLRTLPGTAAEILDDEIRAILCPDKVNTEQWLEAHRAAHEVGLNSNITIMFGSVERPVHWARHMVRTRELQKETGGFTEFVPLPFVHMAAPIYLQKKSRRGPTFREAILMHAVARITYRELVPNIQASWVKTGFAGVRQLLQAGCNDLGGTLMDENISRAAGAAHGQGATEEDFRALVEPLGRVLEQRTTLYGRVPAALVSA